VVAVSALISLQLFDTRIWVTWRESDPKNVCQLSPKGSWPEQAGKVNWGNWLTPDSSGKWKRRSQTAV